MRNPIERAKRALWVLNQPLTKKPSVAGVAISDLFLWRNCEEWKTFFELTDIAGLFCEDKGIARRSATICFFDGDGSLILERSIDLHPNKRHTLDLSHFVSGAKCNFGTFCVFHSNTPQVVSDLGSYITERGYVSYCYKSAPLRSYVHGNLDAICQLPDLSRELLVSTSFLAREYRLQHELMGPAQYEIAIVNPSPRKQRINCQLRSIINGMVLNSQKAELRPGGSHVFSIQIEQTKTARVIIGSHLVMARPLIFRINNHSMEVFHG